MSEDKKNLIKNVAEIFDRLPEKKQERAIGIMQGMILVTEENDNHPQCIEK